MSKILGWESATVGEVFDAVGGGTPNTEEPSYWNGAIPWISSADVESDFSLHPRRNATSEGIKNSPCTEVPVGSVIVVTRVGLGKVGRVTDKPLCFSQDCQALLPVKGVDERFTAYQMKWAAINFLRQSRGTTVSGITKKQLSETTFFLPPSNEQIRIADALDELLSGLDAGVDVLEQVPDKLKLYRAAVLKAAVEGALTAEWRKQNVKTEPASELLKRIFAERRRCWEKEQLRKFKAKGQEPPRNWKAKYREPVAPDTTGLPSLPEAWCWVSWSEVGFSQNGRPFPSREYQNLGIKLLRPGNLFADGLVKWTDNNTRRLPFRYARDDADLIIRGRELIINLTAQSLKDDFLGRVCITTEGEECLLNQRLARLTPVLLPPKFLLTVFRSAYFRTFVAKLNTGSLIQHMFTSQIEDFVFPLPPLEEQQAIVEAVEDQLSVIDHLESDLVAKLTNVQALRQSILRHAFSGKLVQQDRNDEPASELLERIAAQRDRHVREVTAGRVNGRKSGRASKVRGKATFAATKGARHGRVADR